MPIEIERISRCSRLAIAEPSGTTWPPRISADPAANAPRARPRTFRIEMPTEEEPSDTALAAAESSATTGFDTLGLDPKLVSIVADLGYEEPTPIQREGIPAILTGKDVIGQAATGTGKTAAFALPMLHRISQMGKDRAHPS